MSAFLRQAKEYVVPDLPNISASGHTETDFGVILTALANAHAASGDVTDLAI